jgi:hypothetical protein
MDLDLKAPRPKTYPITAITSDCVITGRTLLPGTATGALNDTNRTVLTIQEAEFTALRPDMPVRVLRRPEMHVCRDDVALAVIGDLGGDQVYLLPHKVKLIVHTDMFLINATFYMGPEMRPNDMFFLLPGPFFPATDVSLVPTMPLAVEVERSYPLMYVHRNAVRLFYEAPE